MTALCQAAQGAKTTYEQNMMYLEGTENQQERCF